MELGLYYRLSCPRCNRPMTIGPIKLGGYVVMVTCENCGVVSEYVAYGNSSLVIYCRSGDEKGVLKAV